MTTYYPTLRNYGTNTRVVSTELMYRFYNDEGHYLGSYRTDQGLEYAKRMADRMCKGWTAVTSSTLAAPSVFEL